MKRTILGEYAKLASIFLLAICLLAFNNSAQSQNKPQLYKYKIKEEVYQYKLGDKTVEIVISKTSKRPAKLVYFNMHDNENTSVEATKETIKKFGGTLIELRNNGKRLINFSLKDEQFTVDPNRIFTREGIVKTLKNNGNYSIEAEKEIDKFAANLKNLLKNVRLVIAVHNNSNENYSVKNYETGGEYDVDAKLVNLVPDMDNDDFFFVTDDNVFRKLKLKNQNVALQDNSNATDDGSLSVYCGKNKIPYINVESELGHLREQIKMLEILREATKDFIRIKRKAGRR
jgi:hypothetical protein